MRAGNTTHYIVFELRYWNCIKPKYTDLCFIILSYFAAIYLLYAKLEEEYGLARHAMAVYERATQAVETEERHHMFNIYIKRAAEIYGVTYTRAIYQKAIEVQDNMKINITL